MRPGLTRSLWLAGLLLTLGCTAPDTSTQVKGNTARMCPEATYLDARGIPRSVSTRQIRECFPGEANCFCDRDNDCYRESGYVPCTPPSAADAAVDASPDVGGSALCPEAVYLDARGIPRSVSTRQIRECFPGEARCFCDRDNDCYRESGYVPCTPPSAADAGPEASVDVASGTMLCPEAVYLDARGIPRSVSMRQIRECFPSEARCFCDADNDCYRLSGYVPCTPPNTADAAVDVAPEAAVGTCPEATYLDARGIPRSVSTRQIRECFPGEANCFCDRDNDCYRLSGYVPCTPPGAADAGLDAMPDVGVDVGPDAREAAVDAPPPDVTPVVAPDAATVDAARVTDPVAYTGGFTGLSGLSRNELSVGGASRAVWAYAPLDRGAQPPLLLLFHDDDESGETFLDASGARRVADLRGVILAAPDARFMGPTEADFDHPAGRQRYWDTTRNDVDANLDLLLVRAVIAEAQRRYNVDPARVYALGHGNGGFFSLLTSVALADRLAGFAENAAGLVPCASRASCGFTGTSLTCAGLAAEPGWCACGGAGLPIAPAAGRAVPGYLAHGVEDRRVSPRYTCALAASLQALGVPSVTALRPGGHFVPSHFATDAWAFLAPLRRR